MGKLTKPKSYERFFIQADACLKHNAFDNLHQIQAPTLVIGGEKDNALGGGASREIAAQIPGAELRMYEQWGHGLYEEAGDFNQTVLNFLDASISLLVYEPGNTRDVLPQCGSPESRLWHPANESRS